MKVPRLGLMGGTFDPIHNGHLLLAQSMHEQLSLDRVLFIPAADPPHKDHRDNIQDTRDRWRMVDLAIEGVEHFEACRIEMNRPGKSYTVDTLREFRKSRPQAELFLIVGADNVADMATWQNPDGILELCTVVAGSRLTRGQEADPELAARIQRVDTPILEFSSTEIRRRLQEGRSIRWMVPDSVETYIRSKGLYLS